jgi:hypothetical protein
LKLFHIVLGCLAALAFDWVLLACAGWNLGVCVGPPNRNVSVCVSHDVPFTREQAKDLTADAGSLNSSSFEHASRSQ